MSFLEAKDYLDRWEVMLVTVFECPSFEPQLTVDRYLC